MAPPRVLVFVPLALLVLSGCVESGAQQAPGAEGPGSDIAGPGELRDDAAGLVAIVLDEAELPLEGAVVGFLELGLQAATDASGSARFTNLAPGTYTVSAAALGYQSGARRVALEAGAEASAVFQLVAIPIDVPYHEINGPFDGFFTCKMGLPTQSAACGSVLLVSFRTDDILWANDKAFQWYNMTSDNYRTVVGELTWQQGTFATSTLLRTSFSHERFGSHWFCAAEGHAPLQFRFEKAGRDEAPVCDTGNQGGQRDPVEPTNEKPLVTGFRVPFGRGPSTSNPAGYAPPEDMPMYLAFQQRVTSYVSIFYGENPIDTWQARPDT